eukprot:358619-Chlamydomonas_euryale.AAC.4
MPPPRDHPSRRGRPFSTSGMVKRGAPGHTHGAAAAWSSTHDCGAAGAAAAHAGLPRPLRRASARAYSPSRWPTTRSNQLVSSSLHRSTMSMSSSRSCGATTGAGGYMNLCCCCCCCCCRYPGARKLATLPKRPDAMHARPPPPPRAALTMCSSTSSSSVQCGRAPAGSAMTAGVGVGPAWWRACKGAEDQGHRRVPGREGDRVLRPPASLPELPRDARSAA